MTSTIGRGAGTTAAPAIEWSLPEEIDLRDRAEQSWPPIEYLLAGWWSPESVGTATDLVADVEALLAHLEGLGLLGHRIRSHGDLHKLARRTARNARRLRDVVDDAVPPVATTGTVPADAPLPPSVDTDAGVARDADGWSGAPPERPRRRARWRIALHEEGRTPGLG